MGGVKESRMDKVSSESALRVERVQKELSNADEGLRENKGSMEDRGTTGSERPNGVGGTDFRKNRASIMGRGGSVQEHEKNNEEMKGVVREVREGTDEGKEELMTVDYPMGEKRGNEGDMVISSIDIGKGGVTAKQA